jgi:hypothetical protein
VWFDALLARGLRPTLRYPAGGTAAELTLSSGGQEYRWELARAARRPRPSEITPKGGTQRALWLPATSAALRDALERAGRSWVSDEGRGVLRAADAAVVVRFAPTAGPPQDAGIPAPSGPSLSPGACAVLGQLLERGDPVRQVALARMVGLTQARISQLLSSLDGLGLTHRTRTGWEVADAQAALEVWLAAASTPGGTVSHWYGLDPLPDQLAHALGQAATADAAVRVSGDLAADVLVPWRRPVLVVLYSDRTLNLDAADLVPAPREEATLRLHTTAIRPDWHPDPLLVHALAPHDPPPWPLAPVTQILRDVLASSGPDRDQAAARLRTAWLTTRTHLTSFP